MNTKTYKYLYIIPPENRPKIWNLLKQGKTYAEVAKMFGVSKERIRQLWFHSSNPDRFLSLKERKGLTKKEQQHKIRIEEIKQLYGRETYNDLTPLQKRQTAFFIRKRENCKKQQKWEWALKMTDLDFPTSCPILGIELDWFAPTRQENSPSIDRLDNTKGYVPGNVVICSWRANRIKNDGSLEEHRKITDYLELIFKQL